MPVLADAPKFVSSVGAWKQRQVLVSVKRRNNPGVGCITMLAVNNVDQATLSNFRGQLWNEFRIRTDG